MTTSRARRAVGVAAALGGALASLHSLRETAGHVVDERYRSLKVPGGEGHVTYHLAREGLTTLGAMSATVALAVNLGRGATTGWAPLGLSVGGYLAGQWSGKATAGSWAPTDKALAWHATTAGLLLTGVALLKPRR